MKSHWFVIVPLESKIIGYFNSFFSFCLFGDNCFISFHLKRKNREFLFGTFKNPLLTKTTWNEISKALCSLLQQKEKKKHFVIRSKPLCTWLWDLTGFFNWHLRNFWFEKLQTIWKIAFDAFWKHSKFLSLFWNDFWLMYKACLERFTSSNWVIHHL